MTEFMSQTDAFTWAMESDPRLRSTVVTVIMLDRSPDWGVVRERFESLSTNLPIWRQRVVESPPPTPPRWEDAPDFDLDFHMRRVSAPQPGNLDGVLEMARVAAMADFDRARPLWTATLIDGLDDGGAAVLCKFHHSLTDGVGGVQIAMHLFDLTETPRAIEEVQTKSGHPEVHERGLLADAKAEKHRHHESACGGPEHPAAGGKEDRKVGGECHYKAEEELAVAGEPKQAQPDKSQCQPSQHHRREAGCRLQHHRHRRDHRPGRATKQLGSRQEHNLGNDQQPTLHVSTCFQRESRSDQRAAAQPRYRCKRLRR